MTTTPRLPATPPGTGPGGKRLWRAVVADFELDEHELAMLREAARTVGQLDELAAIVAAEGSMVSSPQGPRVHPALVESRQLKLALSRLFASLRLPSGSEDGRPQRRGAARGAYRQQQSGPPRLRAVAE